jgi:hypothetical protein
MAALGVALLAAALQLPAQPPPAPPLRLATGATPDTVTVGDRFRAVLRLHLPAGARARFSAIPTSDTLQQVDSVRVLADSAGQTTAMYSLVAWIAGITPAANVEVAVVQRGGERAVYRVALRLPYVRSVLHADTTGLRPKPAKGLIPVPLVREWWRLLLLGLAIVAALAVTYWVYRRARRGRTALLDPRAAALARLDALRLGAPSAPPAFAPFYSEVVRVLRVYLAALDPRWGEHLTSTELLLALAATGLPADQVVDLEQLLDEADPVKFAGRDGDADRALRFWSAAREWVEVVEPVAEEDAP